MGRIGDALYVTKEVAKANTDFVKSKVGETGYNILRKVGNTAIKICEHFGW